MPMSMSDSAHAPTPPSPLIGYGGIPIRRTPAPLVRRLQQICATMIAAALADTDVVQLEYAVLAFIDDVPGIDQRRLSEAMGIDRNNVGVIVEKLEARGMVERRINSADKRARELYLTPKGASFWRRFLPKVRAANDQILAPLKPAERKLFVDMLVRLVEGNRVHARPGVGRRKRGSLKLSAQGK